MISEEEILELKKRVEKLEHWKKEQTRKPHLAPVSEIKKLTGWNKERMRRARQNGEIKMIRKNGKILYDLSSINPLLIKKTA